MIYASKEIILFILLLLCVFYDLKYRKIPNMILLPVIILGILLNVYIYKFDGLLSSLSGIFVGIALLFIPFALGGIGAGDVKLLGTIGAIKGAGFVCNAFLASAICGAILSVILLGTHKQLLNVLKWIGKLLKQLFFTIYTGGKYSWSLDQMPSTKLTMPYAVPIAVGTVAVMLMGGIV